MLSPRPRIPVDIHTQKLKASQLRKGLKKRAGKSRADARPATSPMGAGRHSRAVSRNPSIPGALARRCFPVPISHRQTQGGSPVVVPASGAFPASGEAENAGNRVAQKSHFKGCPNNAASADPNTGTNRGS
jgi:hypothetical protein